MPPSSEPATTAKEDYLYFVASKYWELEAELDRKWRLWEGLWRMYQEDLADPARQNAAEHWRKRMNETEREIEDLCREMDFWAKEYARVATGGAPGAITPRSGG